LIEGGDGLPLRHPLAQVRVGDDEGAAFRHRLVGAEVVGVRLRVDDERDRLVAHLGDRTTSADEQASAANTGALKA
jgi:hypothetical protein